MIYHANAMWRSPLSISWGERLLSCLKAESVQHPQAMQCAPVGIASYQKNVVVGGCQNWAAKNFNVWIFLNVLSWYYRIFIRHKKFFNSSLVKMRTKITLPFLFTFSPFDILCFFSVAFKLSISLLNISLSVSAQRERQLNIFTEIFIFVKYICIFS